MIAHTDLIKLVDAHRNSVFLMHQSKEFLLPEHQHIKGQLIYIEGGVAYIHLTHRTLVIPARHYVWIPAGVRHYIEMHRSETIISLYFYIAPEDADPFFEKGGIYPINTLLLEMLRFSSRWEGDVFPGEKAYSFLAGIKNILPAISQRALPISLPTTTNERMQPVIAYINEHIFENLTMTRLCEQSGFSERTLARLFQETMQTSFHQYFKLLRMVKAIEMFLQTDRSISEVAYEIGYNNISAFSNIFHQLTGVRPSDFVKQLRQH